MSKPSKRGKRPAREVGGRNGLKRIKSGSSNREAKDGSSGGSREKCLCRNSSFARIRDFRRALYARNQPVHIYTLYYIDVGMDIVAEKKM